MVSSPRCPCANRFCVRGGPRPRLAEPRLHALETTGPLSSKEQKGKDCHDKQVQGVSFGFVLAPEIDMIFGDGVGASFGSSLSAPLKLPLNPP